MAHSKYATLLTQLGFLSEDAPELKGVADAARTVLAQMGRKSDLAIRNLREIYAIAPHLETTMVIDEQGGFWFAYTEIDMSSFGFKSFLELA